MIRNKINFISGETYTLAELFSGNRKIIIPDLQRDYCWGDKIHTEEKKELVSGFVDNLINQFNNATRHDILNLGLLYGYEAPINFIHLCDGQQRITTLFLLIGMLNRKTNDNSFRKYLISDFEYIDDDQEPYLQYSIRESSLYFLSDLVCHFFIRDEEDNYLAHSCDDIEKSSWFFNDYKYDSSIQSMIRAIGVIDSLLNDKDEEWCYDFGIFLTRKLTFMYYDMGNRKNGEETFVVINTTGEPLSSTQNLKPLILNAQINKNINNISTKWEGIETWFWKHKQQGNDTADAGFSEFLRWITMLESDQTELQNILSKGVYTFPVNKISFEEILSYWEIIKYIFEDWKHCDLLNQYFLSPKESEFLDNETGIKYRVKALSQIDCFLLLPLITHCKNHGTGNDKNLLRLYHYLNNLTRISDVYKNVNSLVFDAIEIAKKCNDVISLLKDNIKTTVKTVFITKEEQKKLSILETNINKRDEIEEMFNDALEQEASGKEHRKIWSGEIWPVIEWACLPDGNFSEEDFKKYIRLFDENFQNAHKDEFDKVRCALLTRDLKGYPRIFKGNSNMSFGWRWEDWKILINENKDKFKKFFDDLSNGISLEQMKKDFDKSKDWAEYVHNDYLLKYCQEKNIRWSDNEGWWLIQKNNATKYISVMNLHLVNFLKQQLKETDWEIICDDTDDHDIKVRNKHKDLVVKICYKQRVQEDTSVEKRWTLIYNNNSVTEENDSAFSSILSRLSELNL